MTLYWNAGATWRCVLLACSMIFVSATAEAKVRISERTKYYSVSGKTGKELFRSITRKGPKTTRGWPRHCPTTQTSFKVNNITFGIKGSRCVVKNVDVVGKPRSTHFPRWKGSHRSSRRFARNWEKFLTLVKKHEATHGRISREFARKLHTRLKKLTRSCVQTLQRFWQILKTVLSG